MNRFASVLLCVGVMVSASQASAQAPAWRGVAGAPVIQQVARQMMQPRPFVQQAPRPFVQQVARPVPQPAPRPFVQQVAQPAPRPFIQQAPRPVVQQVARPVPQPAPRPFVQPVVQPPPRPVVQAAPAPAALGPGWRFLGEGLTSRAYTDGINVRKELKPGYRERAGLLKGNLDALRRDPLLGRVIPATTIEANGTIVQPFANGLSLQQVVSPAARTNATNNLNALLARARTLNVRARVDSNNANFRFDSAGNVISWFDPIVQD
jgi:hypothetical protein